MSAGDSAASRAFTRRILDRQPDGEFTLLDLAHDIENICPAGRRALGRYLCEADADPVAIVAELRAALDAPLETPL
ncbi:MAG: hypothetical protein WCI67_21015 [Chloroflexales bacterium]